MIYSPRSDAPPTQSLPVCRPIARRQSEIVQRESYGILLSVSLLGLSSNRNLSISDIIIWEFRRSVRTCRRWISRAVSPGCCVVQPASSPAQRHRPSTSMKTHQRSPLRRFFPFSTAITLFIRSPSNVSFDGSVRSVPTGRSQGREIPRLYGVTTNGLVRGGSVKPAHHIFYYSGPAPARQVRYSVQSRKYRGLRPNERPQGKRKAPKGIPGRRHPGGRVKAEGLGDGPTLGRPAIAKLRRGFPIAMDRDWGPRLRLTLAPQRVARLCVCPARARLCLDAAAGRGVQSFARMLRLYRP